MLHQKWNAKILQNQNTDAAVSVSVQITQIINPFCGTILCNEFLRNDHSMNVFFSLNLWLTFECATKNGFKIFPIQIKMAKLTAPKSLHANQHTIFSLKPFLPCHPCLSVIFLQHIFQLKSFLRNCIKLRCTDFLSSKLKWIQIHTDFQYALTDIFHLWFFAMVSFMNYLKQYAIPNHIWMDDDKNELRSEWK